MGQNLLQIRKSSLDEKARHRNIFRRNQLSRESAFTRKVHSRVFQSTGSSKLVSASDQKRLTSSNSSRFLKNICHLLNASFQSSSKIFLMRTPSWTQLIWLFVTISSNSCISNQERQRWSST